MIDWVAANQGLVALFTRLAFDAPPVKFKAQIEGRTQRYTDGETKTDLVLSLRSVGPIGEDETDQVDADGEPLEEGDTPHFAQLGNRRVIIECRIETYKNTDANWAFATIERIRTRLNRPSSHAALEAFNFALVDTGPAVALPMQVKGANWSAAAMECTFGTRFMDVERETFNWIARVDITSRVQDTGGQELPAPPNFTIEV